MLRRFPPRIRDRAGALEEVAHSGPLRRARISFGAMWAGESAFMSRSASWRSATMALPRVDAVAGARMAAAALLAPFLAPIGRVRP
jgi:hypothetical protein